MTAATRRWPDRTRNDMDTSNGLLRAAYFIQESTTAELSFTHWAA